MPERDLQAMADDLIAAIEAGGTKFLAAVATSDGRVLAEERIATRAPDETFAAVAAFFGREREARGPVRAGGVASFGPLDLDRSSSGYGRMTTTPKPGWSGIDMLGRVRAIVDAPTLIDSDVNAAGMAEARYGAGRGMNRLCYVTIGTGIGVGVIEHGRPLGGVGHPEAGHMRVPRAPGDEFAGVCPYHGDCLEGLASGPAIAARWGVPAEALGEDHPGWAMEAHYLAELCVNMTYLIRPDRIILGGGVAAHPLFHDRVRSCFTDLLAGYAVDRRSADPATFICAPEAREPSAGLVGAMALARDGLAASDG